MPPRLNKRQLRELEELHALESAASAHDAPERPSSFKGDIVAPADAAYPAAIARWTLHAVRPAAVVAYVRDAGGVARALRCSSSGDSAEGVEVFHQ